MAVIQNLPGLLISDGKPRRGQVGMTESDGARTKLLSLASADSSAAHTTCSFSIAWILHVEYTIRWAEGTRAKMSLKQICDLNLLTFHRMAYHQQLEACKFLKSTVSFGVLLLVYTNAMSSTVPFFIGYQRFAHHLQVGNLNG